MGAFAFRLEREDGTPAEPATFKTALPNWSPGDTIPLGQGALRVVAVRDDDADQPPALVVEDLSESGTSERIAQLRSSNGPVALHAPRRSATTPSDFGRDRRWNGAVSAAATNHPTRVMCDCRGRVTTQEAGSGGTYGWTGGRALSVKYAAAPRHCGPASGNNGHLRAKAAA